METIQVPKTDPYEIRVDERGSTFDHIYFSVMNGCPMFHCTLFISPECGSIEYSPQQMFLFICDPAEAWKYLTVPPIKTTATERLVRSPYLLGLIKEEEWLWAESLLPEHKRPLPTEDIPVQFLQ